MAKKCESCGMPLSRDPQGGGTKADGTKSDRYCSLCYDAGAFRHPDLTAAEFQAHCMAEMRKNGMPKIMAWLFSRGIPNLPRWKS